MVAAQNEKAFQKQPTIFIGKERKLGKKANASQLRFTREVGLGFKTPKTAINGTYVDKKCPFTGNVSIRGRILKGIVSRTKMTNTIVVRRNYMHYIKKYKRYEKRHKTISAHCSPAFRIFEGDDVIIGQCRYVPAAAAAVVAGVYCFVTSRANRGARAHLHACMLARLSPLFVCAWKMTITTYFGLESMNQTCLV
jgi:small subunit ribosomal protein S11e